MSACISKWKILEMMRGYEELAEEKSWDAILEEFAARVASMSGSLTAVQVSSLVLIGASISKRTRPKLRKST